MQKQFLFLLPLMLVFNILVAQKTSFYDNPNQNFNQGKELFEKEKYVASQQFFEKAIEQFTNTNSILLGDARFYRAVTAIRLFNDDADYLMINFIAQHPENAHYNIALFEMGIYQYTKKRYKEAVEWLAKVDANALTDDQQPEFYFKKGYSYFQIDDMTNAKTAFFEIKDKDTKYTSPAIYYYAHIAYNEKNYETALIGFKKLINDDTFAEIVPYYITQILYLQKKYDEVIRYAPSLLENITEKRKAETARIIGESYYRLGRYQEAIPYLETYKEENAYLTNEDKYQLGFAYYKGERYADAAAMFERVVNNESELGQNAMYHLADCYLKLEDKQKARMAFFSASRLEFNQTIREDALFNYASLTYELAYSPFNEAIKAFNEYINTFPDSKRIDEAYNFLVMAYMNTKNYKDALESIEKIKNKNEKINQAYQRVLFFRGLELFNNLNFNQSVQLFDQSLKYPFDKIIVSRSLYWKSEAYSRLGSNDMATAFYEQFFRSPAAKQTNEYTLAHYGMGYAYFNQKNYAVSADWFQKFISLMNDRPTSLTADAYNRIGDIRFVNTRYKDAIDNYRKAYKIKMSAPDYSMFQEAFSLGLLNKHNDKILLLSKLLNEFPASTYADDALYEIGHSYVNLLLNDKAITYFEKILSGYPQSSYAPKALIQLGLIAYNKGDNAQAIAYYKRAVNEFPTTSEARNALTAIKNLYIESGEGDKYVDYANTLGEYANVSLYEQDSLLYRSAENLYLDNNCSKASPSFLRYLEKFPNGSFAVNAHFYLADCYNRNHDIENALIKYNEVIRSPKNMFSEQALAAASIINASKGNWDMAIENYLELEKIAETPQNIMLAKTGLMTGYFNLKNYSEAINWSQKVLNSENVSAEKQREAHFILGRSFQETGKPDLALTEYKKAANEIKSAAGAESKFRISEIYFTQKELDKSEKEIFDFIDRNSPQQYWLARAFLLLSDVYVAKNDEFQAMHTLQSIIDYYEIEDDGILEDANNRKKTLLEKEDGLKKKSAPQDIEIHISDDKKPVQ